MRTLERVDQLIETGWNVLETDFDPAVLRDWRQQAFEYLRAELGPEHPYTQHFHDYVQLDALKSLLAVEGLLAATREGNMTDPNSPER